MKVSFDSKILFALSSGGTFIGLTCMGIYTYLQTLEYTMDGFTWIPVASFSFCIFIASWGVLTLPFLVIAELMPEKVKFVVKLTNRLLMIFNQNYRFVVLAVRSA